MERWTVKKKAESVLRVLTDCGGEYCGRADSHRYQLFLALQDIEHTKTKAQTPPDQRLPREAQPDDRKGVLRRGLQEKTLFRPWRDSGRLGQVHGFVQPGQDEPREKVQRETPLETFAEGVDIYKRKVYELSPWESRGEKMLQK